MLFWRDPDWELRNWYGNIQAPLKRTAIGFDTADYLLDVWIDPDLPGRGRTRTNGNSPGSMG